jgi:hypothetical protein
VPLSWFREARKDGVYLVDNYAFPLGKVFLFYAVPLQLNIFIRGKAETLLYALHNKLIARGV